MVLLFVVEVRSQNYFKEYQNLDFTKEYPLLKKEVDSLLRLCENEMTFVKISGDFSKRIWYSHLDDAIYYVNVSITSLESIKNQETELSALYFRRGYFHYRQGKNSQALINYKKVIALNAVQIRVAQSYCEIGRIYLDEGDFYEAVEYYKEGIRILEELKDYKKIINQYLNLAIVYDGIGGKNGIENKIRSLQKAESLLAKIPFDYNQEISLNNSLAFLYIENGLFDFKKARKYHFKNLALYRENNDSENTCNTYANLADLYNLVKKDSAKVFIEKGMNFCNDSITIAKYKHQLSTFFKHKKEYTKALGTLQSTLNTIGNLNDEIKDVQNISILKKLSNIPYIVDVLIDKSNLLMLRGTSENVNDDLVIALQNIKLADQLLSYLHQENREEQSKLYWRSKASQLYALGVSIAMILNDHNAAFYFIERNKAIILIEGIKENVDDRLPLSVKERKHTLKKEILKKEKEEPNRIESDLFQYKQRYQKFIDSLKVTFPTYNDAKSQAEVISVEEIQQKLEKNTAIVSYIWNADDKNNPTLHGVLITKEEAHVFDVKETRNVISLVADFRQRISQPFETITNKKSFQETAHDLYKLLFPEEKVRRLLTGKKLIIVPDGELQNIPFEALITNKNTNEYLIETNQISYAYSVSFLVYNSSLQREVKKGFVGFAPISFRHDSLSTLKKTADELKSIQAVMNGRKFLQNEATKNTFFSEAPGNSMLHLATHAEASGNPWIAFHDSKLMTYELYTSSIPAELVVLSGCGTSLGEISQGEGVMSLSRGFFHAGANTVVSTLWNVNDKATAKIMESFYKNLKSGQSKAMALHNAKLQYLQTTKTSEVAPYYWASIILMGDGEIVLYTSFLDKFLWVLGGIVLFLGVFFIFIKRKLNSSRYFERFYEAI
ncbi:CHAT domain-containing protein [Tenacibaculum agarivorans]|uniref:CHAT domain-containing protein n=1 Tax=Tenacibaculum agarivorans TaxID=1908389 RepID=UPI000A47B546|nr:CHAT domain-containing tetratricopeptide repeat protein [Tenacibaculum agarivorans]